MPRRCRTTDPVLGAVKMMVMIMQKSPTGTTKGSEVCEDERRLFRTDGSDLGKLALDLKAEMVEIEIVLSKGGFQRRRL